MKLILSTVVLASLGFAQLPPPCPEICPPSEFSGKTAPRKKQSKEQKPKAEGEKKAVK